MDVAVWLQSLGLERYEALFRENDIDAEVLSDLTDGDLEKIGVSLGHRKRLLKAAAALAAGPAPAPPAAAAPVPLRRPCRRGRAPPAHRHVLQTSSARPRFRRGSIRRTCARSSAPIRTPVRAWWRATTALSRSSWATASSPISAFPARMRTTPRARSMRGWKSPRSSPGCRPARAKNSPCASASRPASSSSAISSGKGSAQEQAVVGDTPNLAARLQGLADAGGVVVAAATRRLIGDRFRLKDLGKHAVKGLAEPVEAFAALGLSAEREPLRGGACRAAHRLRRARGRERRVSSRASAAPGTARARSC